MSIEPKVKLAAPRRERRTPQQARALALRSARNLLITQGPNAITLQAVASELGMSHTNLIHHFGSASGLQTALMHHMVGELTSAIESAVERFRSGSGDGSDFVNLVFEAFDTGGAGALAAWIMLSGEGHRLAPVGEVVQSHTRNLERDTEEDPANAHDRVTAATLLVTVAAFGDAVIGRLLRQVAGREQDSVRRLTTEFLAHLVPPPMTEAINPD